MKNRSVQPGPAYAGMFAALRGAAPEPAWLSARREAAFAQLGRDGFPTRFVEEWKYTDISALAARPLVLPAPAGAGDLAAAVPFQHADDLNVVFVDGRYVPERSNAAQAGVLELVRMNDIGSDPEAPPPDALVSALLNAAFRTDGVQVRIPAGRKIERRIHFILIHASETPDVLLAPWISVTAGDAAEARLAVTSVSCSAAACLHVPRVLVHAEAGAQLTVSQAQVLNPAAWQLATTRIEQRRDSRVVHLDAALGSALGRHDLTAVLLESNSEVELNGLYALQAQRLQTLGDELAAVRATLNERKLIERAKGLLMEHQGLDESAAYHLLRQTATNQNRHIADVAQVVLSMADLLPARR